MKPKKGESNSEMEEDLKDPLQLVKELVLLIAEARTPDLSVKGRVEGPHCPVIRGRVAHKCNAEKVECLRASEFCFLVQQLWHNNIPICLDIILFPECSHGRDEAHVTEGTVTSVTKENTLLVERWTINTTKKRQEGYSSNMLLQAVRSYLHFSQISSWLYSIGGKLPGILTYRVYAPGEVSGIDFPQPPDEHIFPVCQDTITVNVLSLKRQTTVPALMCAQFDFQECRHRQGVAASHRKSDPQKGGPAAGDQPRKNSTAPPGECFQQRGATAKRKAKPRVRNHSTVERNALFVSSPAPENIAGCAREKVCTGTKIMTADDIARRKAQNLAKMRLRDGGDCPIGSTSVSHDMKAFIKHSMSSHVGDMSDCAAYRLPSKHLKGSELGRSRSHATYQSSDILSAMPTQHRYDEATAGKHSHLIRLAKDDLFGSHDGKLRKFGKFKKKDGEKDLRIEQRKCWMGDVGAKTDQPYPQGIGVRSEDAWTQPRKKVRNPPEKVAGPLYSTGGKKCMGEVNNVKKSGAEKELLFALHTKAKLEQSKTVASSPYLLEKKEFSTSARQKKNTISQKEASEEEFIRKLSDRLSLYSLSPKDLPTKDLRHEDDDDDGRLKRSKQHQRSSQKSHSTSTEGQDNEISGIERSSKLKLTDHTTSRTMKGLNPMLPEGLVTRSLDGVITRSKDGAARLLGGVAARSLGEANAWSIVGSNTFSELTVNVSSSHDFLDDSDSTPVASPKQSSSHQKLLPTTHQKALPSPHKRVNAKSVAEKTMKLNVQKYHNDEKKSVSDRRDDSPAKSKYEHSTVGHLYPAGKENSSIEARGFNDLLPGSSPPSRSPEPLADQSHQSYSACDLYTKDLTSEHIHSLFYYSQCDAKVQDGQWPQDKVRESYSYSEEHPFFGNFHRAHSENGGPVPERSHSQNGGPVPERSRSQNGGPVPHTANDKVYSRKMFEENLLPLVSYDAGSDTFKSVEHSVSANVLHSPKVLFSLEVPEESLRDSRKCIDFGENLESEFFRSKIGDDVNTDVISKYMASLAAMSVSGGNLATGSYDIGLESGGNNTPESQSGVSADEITGGVRSGEKTSENFDLTTLLTDEGDVGHHGNTVCGGWYETNSTKQSIARRQLNYSPVQERSNLVPTSSAESRESAPTPQNEDKSIDALHSSSGGSPNNFETFCSESPMLSSSFSSSSSSSSSGSSVRMASPVSHPVSRMPECTRHNLCESSNEQSSALQQLSAEDPWTTNVGDCMKQGNALFTQTSNAAVQPFTNTSPPVASGPYDDTFGEPSHGDLKGTTSLSSVSETHMGDSKLPAPSQDRALIPELVTTVEKVFCPSSFHIKSQELVKLGPLKQGPTDDSTENPPFVKAASTDQALQLKPFNLSDNSLPTLRSGSSVNPTKQESLQLSSLSNHCDNDDLINRTLTLTELNTCNTTFNKHDSPDRHDGPNTHYKLNKHGTLSQDFFAPKVPHFAMPVKHSGCQTALQNINEVNGHPVECRMEKSNLNRNSSCADTCLSAYTRDVDTSLAIYVQDSDTCLISYSQVRDGCLGVGTQDGDFQEIETESQLKAIIPTNPSADSVLPTHQESQTCTVFLDPENDILGTTTDTSSEEVLDPGLPVAGCNYLNDINSSKGALVAVDEIASVSSQCKSKSVDSSWLEEAVNNNKNHSDSLSVLNDSGNVHEDTNAPTTVDAYVSDDNTHVMFYISESKDANSTHSPPLKSPSPSAQTSMLTSALQLEAIQQCALSSARVSSFSAETDLEITSRNNFGKPKCETASLSSSPPLHGDPPGWSSIPPHRTVSTPSCMDREVKSQDPKPTRPSVINMQYCDTASQIGLRKMAVKSASMIFNSRTGLPTQSSPAPLKRKPGGTFDYDANLLNTRALKSAFSCSKLAMNATDKTNENEEDKRITLSTSAPASTNCLLGNFEESILNGRIDPVGTVEGFTAEIGASGSFCPKHLHVPVSAFFFALSDDNAPSPYLGHINLESVNKKGYHIPKKGTVQVTLFNPNKTVVKMFVVRYDLSDMPASSQTFIRQRTVYCPTDINSTAPSFLRYLIHLRCASSRSGKIYLHTDIRLIFARHKLDIDAKSVPYELKSYTEGPQNPKYSPKK